MYGGQELTEILVQGGGTLVLPSIGSRIAPVLELAIGLRNPSQDEGIAPMLEIQLSGERIPRVGTRLLGPRVLLGIDFPIRLR
jgi:hypothetical protein